MSSILPRFPVFIVGSPRSGTSATVDAFIAAGYRGYREGNFLPVAYQMNLAIDRHYKSFDIGTNEILLGCIDKVELKQKVNEIVFDYVDTLNPEWPWFEKTGGADMIRLLPAILLRWPSALVVYSKRRAIENIFSRIRKFPGESFEYHCVDWARTMNAWRQTRQILPPAQFLEIDQYDMIREPANTAATLGRFLELDQEREDSMLAMLEKTRPQETESGSAIRVLTLEATGWSAHQRQTFIKHCSQEMEAFGYTLDATYRS